MESNYFYMKYSFAILLVTKIIVRPVVLDLYVEKYKL